MSDNKPIIFVEELNLPNIILFYIYYLYGFKIFYRLKSKFLEKKFFNNIFNNHFKKISLNLEINENARKIFNESFKEKSFFLENFWNDIIKNNLFAFLLKNFKYLNNDLNKLKLCFYEKFDDSKFNLADTSYLLIKKFFLDNNILVFYYPSNIINFLLLKSKENKNLKIYKTLLIYYFINNIIFKYPFKILRKIYFNIYKIFLNLKKKKIGKNLNKIQNSDYKFAIFPHGQSLKYGQSFKKTFLYENDQNSSLYKKKNLTIWLEDKIEKSTERFLKINSIPYLFYSSKNLGILEKLNFYLSILLFFINIKKIKDFSTLMENILIIIVIRNIITSKIFLEDFKKLKYIYIFYDILFPKSLLYAANILGIKTMAYQERLSSYLWSSPLFFDYYFINGSIFKKILPNYKFVIQNYITSGIIRSDLIKSKKNSSFSKKILNIKKDKKIILCIFLYFKPCTNEYLDLFGCDGFSRKTNLIFFQSIISLAKKFSDCCFILKAKDQITNEELRHLYPEIFLDMQRKNIEISNRINSYELAYYSDLIIGKQTNLMEEILASNRKVIFYDTEKHLSTLNYELKNIGIVLDNYKDLEEYFIKYLNKSEYYFTDKINLFIKNYLKKNYDYSAFDFLRKNVKLIINN